jgi:hypothetical protein
VRESDVSSGSEQVKRTERALDLRPPRGEAGRFGRPNNPRDARMIRQQGGVQGQQRAYLRAGRVPHQDQAPLRRQSGENGPRRCAGVLEDVGEAGVE